jgi:hypothetical protein
MTNANVWYYVPAQWDGATALPVQIGRPTDVHQRASDSVPRAGCARQPDRAEANSADGQRLCSARHLRGAHERSIEYDTVDDTFSRYYLKKILPEINKHVRLRTDAYSRAMVGESSGAICSFNAAFLKPGEFLRVLSWIGSYAALQTGPAHTSGGAEYPVMLRREMKGAPELPESLTWLWRDYDPSKSSQDFAPDPRKKDLPFWRVVVDRQ